MSKTKLETLTVDERAERGKGPSRRLRAAGKVPGIYYDQKGANIMVQVDKVPLEKAQKHFGSSHVFTLEINRTAGGSDSWPALLWRVKHDPVKNLPTHVDFFGVDLDKEIRVSVPFESTGTPVGEKEGGILQWYRDSIEVTCKPMDIPESILLDVSGLDINDSISIETIQFPEGVTPFLDTETEDSFAIVGVAPPMSEEELEAELAIDVEGEEPEVEGEEPAEGEEAEGGEGEDSAEEGDSEE